MDSALSGPQPPAQSLPRKVPSACQRCRRQKLKCDVRRPCTLCVRAGADCSAGEKPTMWRTHNPERVSNRTRKREGAANLATTKRPRRAAHLEDEAGAALPSPEAEAITLQEESTALTTPVEEDSSVPSQEVGTPWTSSSAAINFVDEAFHHHDTATLERPEASAFSARQWVQANTPGQAQRPLRISMCDGAQRRVQSLRKPSAAEVELLSLLPPHEAATVLVDNYFDRIHWFMLVFHQSEFREGFQQLYYALDRQSTENSTRLGFLSVFAAVCVVSIRYTNAHQKAALARSGVQHQDFQQKLLTTLRLRLLDVVSLGSIEAVQTCVLLGSFYLYHGEPELAWPICGCGLRIAQALHLHRRIPSHDSNSPDLDDPVQRAIETRKRCWWAVYEIETFCSMLYGFPLSITDDDCDIELLDPYAVRSRDPTWDAVAWRANGEATLLSHKYAMAQLSIIVKSALTDLYGLRQSRPEKSSSAADNGSCLQNLISNVRSLDARLHGWYRNLPKRLRSTGAADLGSNQGEQVTLNDAVGVPDAALRDHLFQLQALALKLAFENARILVHRPLLSFKMVSSSHPQNERGHPGSAQAPDPFRSSIQACRDAALKLSRIGSTSIFKEVADTYAVSFVSLHLFTAAVSLSIMTSLEPLSPDSYESKMGIRRLMEMQSRLKTKSIVAEQGLGILKKLLSLVLAKEMEKMFEFQDQTYEFEQQPEPAHGALEAQSAAGGDGRQVENEQIRVEASDQNAAKEPPRSTALVPPPGTDSMQAAGQDTTTALTFDFYEDPMMAQALLDFEQVFNYIPDEPAGDSSLPLSGGEYLTGSCFSGQDQTWIWGSNHRI